MRLLRFVRQRPIALLSVFAVAFVVWLWRDSVSPPPAGAVPKLELKTVAVSVTDADWVPPRRLPPGVEVTANGKAPAQALSKLKPGMTRAEVEGLVGVPLPIDISPVTVADGRVTYHTTYEADPEPPPTVRRIRTPRVPPPRDPRPTARVVVVLEFDATKPGHPLLDVYYPAPLF